MKQLAKVLFGVTCWSVGLVAVLSADTLVMRDGRRLRGELVAVRDEVVEFERARGLFSRERVRVDRSDVLRIEFDDARDDRDSRDRRDGSIDRDGRDGRDGGDSRGGPREGGLFGAPGGGDRPAGMREREVRVDARSAWIDTGVTLRAGQTVYFVANGRVHWGPGRDDGPAGEHDSPRNESRPMPNRPAAALIGRLGTSADYFYIGADRGAIRMREGGRLSLGINDDYLQDNSGAFLVTIYY